MSRIKHLVDEWITDEPPDYEQIEREAEEDWESDRSLRNPHRRGSLAGLWYEKVKLKLWRKHVGF